MSKPTPILAAPKHVSKAVVTEEEEDKQMEEADKKEDEEDPLKEIVVPSP
jgi:hypothetical protein